MAEELPSKYVEPTFRMKPYEESKFQPSACRKISEEVCKQMLDGKSWNGEEEAVWTVQITEQVKNRVKGE